MENKKLFLNDQVRSRKVSIETSKAHSRIGTTSSDALTWVIRFAQTSLEGLSEGDFSNLSKELYVFGDGAYAEPPMQTVVRKAGAYGSVVEQAPDIQAAKVLQGLVLQCLDELGSRTQVNFHFHDVELVVLPSWDRKSTMVGLETKTRLDAFRYFLAQVLGAHAHLIERCPECNKWFVRVRLRQKFCSPRCRSRAGTREFRHRQPKT